MLVMPCGVGSTVRPNYGAADRAPRNLEGCVRYRRGGGGREFALPQGLGDRSHRTVSGRARFGVGSRCHRAAVQRPHRFDAVNCFEDCGGALIFRGLGPSGLVSCLLAGTQRAGSGRVWAGSRRARLGEEAECRRPAWADRAVLVEHQPVRHVPLRHGRAVDLGLSATVPRPRFPEPTATMPG